MKQEQLDSVKLKHYCLLKETLKHVSETFCNIRSRKLKFWTRIQVKHTAEECCVHHERKIAVLKRINDEDDNWGGS